MVERGYEIDLFRPGDAAGVAQLFREVYGNDYPVKIVYDPEEFAKAVARQDYISVVARTPEGGIVGFSSFYRSAPNQNLYEMGLGMVSAEYRRTAILGLLMRRLVKAAFTSPGFDAFFGEAVCNHILMQKGTAVFKTVETAIEVDLMPSEAYEKEESAAGRVSTVVSTRTLVPRPHVIYVPEIYDEYLAYIYSTFDDGRTLKRSDERLPSGRSTGLAVQTFEGAQVARISVNEAGSDFETILDPEEKEARSKDVTVIQVWLNLSLPWVGICVDILRSRGYFFCGTFPRWFGEDGLLMEKIKGRPNWEGINLYTDRAKQILRFIRDDWERTQRDSLR
ncbi:MAG: hypothetical protein A4E64_03141 [Syntrophorhabdus sp. PtaU1.Bin058]|nr:MAG: hypothetical protein A4E64_03141 [Syntrophorhabdus sp. PtaU1.Bin058]